MILLPKEAVSLEKLSHSLRGHGTESESLPVARQQNLTSNTHTHTSMRIGQSCAEVTLCELNEWRARAAAATKTVQFGGTRFSGLITSFSGRRDAAEWVPEVYTVYCTRGCGRGNRQSCARRRHPASHYSIINPIQSQLLTLNFINRVV